MSKKHLVMLLLLYVASTAISFGVFSVLGKNGGGAGSVTPAANQAAETKQAASALGQLLAIDPKAPRDQACPLDGKLYTQTEADAWSKRRPLAVMIENHPDARPQSGLSNADIVFEAMAEGGVTRFMGMFYCDVQANDTTLAPIRSARQYFWELASGFNWPLYVHVGGANTPGPADALGHIADAGWNGQNDMNQFSIGYPAFVRDYNRIPGKDLATEHTMVTSTEKLWQVAAKRGWTNITPSIQSLISLYANPSAVMTRRRAKATAAPIASGSAAPVVTDLGNSSFPAGQDWKDGYQPWQFQNGSPATGSVNPISFEFWNGFDQYAVRWEYDSSTNSYKRVMAGQPHIDLNNNQQIVVKNAVVLFAEEKGPIDEKKHMLYTLSGVTGDALIFQNGQTVKAKWSKASRTAELFFTDESGKPIQFVRGMIWISIVSPTTKVSY